MKNSCSIFRKKLAENFGEGNLQNFLKENLHPEHCQKCRSHLSEFIVTEELFANAKFSEVAEPNFSFMRKKVWDEIDRRENRRTIPAGRIFKPALTTLLAVIVIGLSIYLSHSSPGNYSYNIYDELDAIFIAESLSDNELQEMLAAELSEEIMNYFIDNESYEVIEDLYLTGEEWDKLASELAITEF